ncbi:hypothetical protein HHK36_005287 [Tetracentron sinense]|uniref:C3H1-type domain-containing protein n=1 Tax=Tetracentron sinense TaxID=13715 RepID=A0A835DM79_TETSI|nr:hypothetical protein HHK36_005287 [Tetracentron sinense]
MRSIANRLQKQIEGRHKTFRDIDIPPRRLLTRRSNLPISSSNNASDPLIDPSEKPTTEQTSLQKFLPYNGGDNEDSDPYSSDDFQMYEFKIRRCMRSRSHDWTQCPFSHPGEKARRRDPRRFHYSGNVCADFRRGGSCLRGDACEFAHGVFECWLHPARYRTQACKDGKNCKRKVCFFAHTPRQLRVLPLHYSQSHPLQISSAGNRNYLNSVSASASDHCCVFCHSLTSSPTSTLMGLSHFSPPLSPVESRRGYSLLSGYDDRSTIAADSSGLNQFLPGVLSYKKALTEITSSMEAMELRGDSPTCFNNRNLSRVDVSSNRQDRLQQFIMSPSTPKASAGSREFFNEKGLGNSLMDEKSKNNHGWSCPDLDWVNELVM